MRKRMVVAWAAALAAGCLAPVVEGRVDGGPTGGGAAGGGVATGGAAGGATGNGGGASGSGGGSPRACALDSECAPGELCEECNGVKSCITGCNPSRRACPPQTVCRALGIACKTCPCPNSECVNANNCVDGDGDGFVAGTNTLPGPGCALPGGDCDPGDPRVFPGAVEDCNNGRDDDCNGRVDLADVACQTKTCSDGACASSWDCGIGRSTCGVSASQAACCLLCPDIAPPQCPPNARWASLGPDPFTGCARLGCLPLPSNPCPANFAPVCAASSAGGLTTFGNLCEAQAVGAQLLHTGECLTGEGLSCDVFPSPAGVRPPGCGPSGTLYCRDTCPTCDASVLRCTKVGACVVDLDCPAGLPPPPPAPCPFGAPWQQHCEANVCVARCG